MKLSSPRIILLRLSEVKTSPERPPPGVRHARGGPIGAPRVAQMGPPRALDGL